MKRWTYSDASICQVGTMICTACRQPIKDGALRYREDDSGFLPQHRACCPDDPEWEKIVKRQQEHAAFYERRKAALQAYVNEFGAPDDDMIDEVMRTRSPVSRPQHRQQEGS